MAFVNIAELKDSVTPMTDYYPGWTPLEGKPAMKTYVISTSANGTMEAGYWECEPGKFHVKLSAFEFLCILEGKAIITPTGGKPVHISAGSAVSCENGFEGTWEVVEKIRKFWSVQAKSKSNVVFPHTNSIVLINPGVNFVTPITENLEGWTPVDGNPKMKTYILKEVRDKTVMSGYWECTPGTYKVKADEYEFLKLIEGKIIITPKGGKPVVVVAGEAATMEKGFEGTWTITQKVKKFWMARL